MVMSDLDVENNIRTYRDAIDSEVCSRARVVDSLLDLRLDAASRLDLVELVDRALTEVPGRNLVPAEWWREQLDIFEIAALNSVEPVG